MPSNLESSLSPWSARARWTLRGVGVALGLIWGLLGLAIQTFVFRGSNNLALPEALAFFGVVIGMMLGVGHASQFWLARSLNRSGGLWYGLEVLVWAFVCVVLGVLWGSPLVLLGLLFSSVQVPIGATLIVPVFGAILSLYSVVPAAILMAPLTVFVWRKTLGHLESQRVSRIN
jgi:hypothetical protein